MATVARIYILIDPLTEEIRYVGWTSREIGQRLKEHQKCPSRCHRTWWIKSLAKQGLTPRVQLLQEVPVAQWSVAERYWVKYFRQVGCPLTNNTDGGEGRYGFTTSDETKAKLSAASKRQFESLEAKSAVSRVHKGKEISAEHRAIVSAAAKKRWVRWRAEGKVTSDETRGRISAARRGKGLSDEHRRKIAASLKGKPKSPEHREKLAKSNRERASYSKEVQ